MERKELTKSGNYSIQLPCTIGTKVYVLAQCKDIPSQLDGTYTTATGYYCPYENECPYEVDNCEETNGTLNIFEDTVDSIIIDEIGIRVTTKNINEARSIGDYAFLTREEAIGRLTNIRERNIVT